MRRWNQGSIKLERHITHHTGKEDSRANAGACRCVVGSVGGVNTARAFLKFLLKEEPVRPGEGKCGEHCRKYGAVLPEEEVVY